MKNFTDTSEEPFYGFLENQFSKKTIGERLRNARNAANLTLQQVGEIEELGVKRNTLQQWETGATEASISSIFRLAKLYNTNPISILTGESFEHHAKQTDISEEYALIPAYDIEVSAGHGMFSDGAVKPSRHLAFRKRWIRARGLDTKHLAVLFTKGDSMEPTIPDGSAIVVDNLRNKPLDGKIYVIRIDDRLWVKRVQWTPSGGLRLISDNQIYNAFEVSKKDLENDDIEVCGQVIHYACDLPD